MAAENTNLPEYLLCFGIGIAKAEIELLM